LLLDAEKAGFGISCSERENTRPLTCVTAHDRLGNIGDHTNDAARLPIEDPHFILALATTEQQILPLVEAGGVKVGSNSVVGLLDLLD